MTNNKMIEQNAVKLQKILKQFEKKSIEQNMKYLSLLPVGQLDIIKQTVNKIKKNQIKQSKLPLYNRQYKLKNMDQYVKRYIDNIFYEDGISGLDKLEIPSCYERVMQSFNWAGQNVQYYLSMSSDIIELIQLSQLTLYQYIFKCFKYHNINITFLSDEQIQYKDLSEQNKKIYDDILKSNIQYELSSISNQKIKEYQEYVNQSIQKQIQQKNIKSLQTWYSQNKFLK